MRLVLVGFMGAGKTVIGKKISSILNIEFIDMDEVIEKNEGMPISSIFQTYGEIYFRSLEKNLLKKLIRKENIIISTGGGVIEDKDNYELLKSNGEVIFLKASPETIMDHLKNSMERRPLLENSKDPADTIRKLLKNRHNKYIEVSDIIIDVNGKDIEEVVSDVLVYTK